jgi:hypothetical protein
MVGLLNTRQPAPIFHRVLKMRMPDLMLLLTRAVLKLKEMQ